VPNDDLDAGLQLPFVPGFPQLRGNFRGQYSDADAFFCEDALQPARHVPFLGIDREDLSYVEYACVGGLIFILETSFVVTLVGRWRCSALNRRSAGRCWARSRC
jgi:hypothetical protein